METPLTDTVTKPVGLGFDARTGQAMENAKGGATRYFVRRVQKIREDLWTLMVALDAIDGITDGAQMMVLQSIDMLGVAARCETLYAELSPEQTDAIKRLFEDEPRTDA